MRLLVNFIGNKTLGKFLIDFIGRKTLIALLLISMTSLMLDMIGISLIFPFLKLFVSPEIVLSLPILRSIYNALNFTSVNSFVIVAGLGLIVLYCLKLYMKWRLNKAAIHTHNSVTFRLASYLFRGMLEAKYAILTEQSISEMVTIINSHTINGMISLEAWVIIFNETLLMFIVVLVFVFWNPLIALATLGGFAAIGLLLYAINIKKIPPLGQEQTQLCIQVYKVSTAAANSIKDIKIMRLENKYYEEFSKKWGAYSKNYSQYNTLKSVPKEISETLVFSGIVIVCLYVLITSQNITNLIPTLGVMALTAMRILPSFNRVIMSFNDTKFYRPSLRAVKNLYTTLEQNRQDIQHVSIPFDRTLEIRDISFKYGEKTVFDSISLQISKGSSIAFVGASGAGKSTLLDVLMGLREASQGAFFLDGKQFDPFRTDALCSRAGYVPQNVNLIDESVAFNISFEHKYNTEKMDQIIKSVRLSKYVDELKDGLNTVIGESGVRVSGGQKQRIGIARALYRDPEILVFDEATSALDNVTERELMGEINALSGSKTLIIVAHRLSTVENCDTIYLLDQGRIIAQGTHKELLATSPEYQNMYNQQQNK